MGVAKLDRRTELIIIILLAAVVYLGRNLDSALLDESDATNAEVALRIVQTGDWLAPHSDFVPRLNKPPLLYWMSAASYELFGISAFAARLPAALAGVGVVILAFLIGSLFSLRRAAWFSGLTAVAIPGLFIFTYPLFGDIVETFFLSLAFYLFLLGYLARDQISNSAQGKRALYVAGFYPCLALAVMTKGLTGLIFPFATILIFLLISRNLGYLKQMRPWGGLLLFVLLTAPWHIAMELRYPGFSKYYFINEHIMRALNRHYPPDFMSVSLGHYWAAQVGALFPWVFFIPLVWRYLPSNPRAMTKDESILTFVAVWALTVLLFFSIAGRLEYYALSSYPACAVLAGAVFANAERQGGSRGFARASAVVLLFCVLLGVGSTVALAETRALRVPGMLLDPRYRNAFFSPIVGLPLGYLRPVQKELAVFGVTVLVSGILAYVLTRRGRVLYSHLALAVGMLFVFGAVRASIGRFEPQLSSKRLAEEINKRWRSGDVIVAKGEFFTRAGLGFYTRKPVYLWRAKPDWVFGSRYEGSSRMYLNDSQISRLWNSNRRVFLVGNRDELRNVPLLGNGELTLLSGDNVLLMNRVNRRTR